MNLKLFYTDIIIIIMDLYQYQISLSYPTPLLIYKVISGPNWVFSPVYMTVYIVVLFICFLRWFFLDFRIMTIIFDPVGCDCNNCDSDCPCRCLFFPISWSVELTFLYETYRPNPPGSRSL